MNDTAHPNDESEGAQPRTGVFRRPRVRITAILAVALAAGFVAWLVVERGSSSTPPATRGPAGSAGSGPVALSPRAMSTLSRKLHHPVYWAGPKPGYRYEVTQRRDGIIYVRYLP